MRCSCFGALFSQKRHLIDSEKNLEGFSSEKNISLFSYIELKSATDNFHPSNKIGRGGFGTVYKGILRNGVTVAVKVLSADSRQGVREFLTEIDVITNIKHSNLVELIGCCVEGSNRILVYEYLENGSLDRALLGSNSDAVKLNWYIRSAICMGIARGLMYLHEELQPPVVHRDIKASNILLDRNFLPKIGDFGVAKLFPDNITHISTRVAGTTGYLAPEYALKGQLTKKADIYSFGVLVLEIISGRRNSKSWLEMGMPLLEWTWTLLEEERLTELVDAALKDYPEEQVIRYIKVALFCTQAAAGRRPSVSQVVEMLSRPVQLNNREITRPGYMEDSGITSRGLRATNSTFSRLKDSTSGDTTTPFSLTHNTFTEMSPR
ncbi:LRR receptor-like serine threonine-protein kinase [Musa troglodytarum]|uniref:LRR receptor-like serine threonine-protein kinase n=1 Tax=Musa troglodytarum TaxID=320322 RepID=A0A9E7JC50_9LILI|nr:LRR receptor-like serine threonine-protein kinase [Musa troglodytarum]